MTDVNQRIINALREAARTARSPEHQAECHELIAYLDQQTPMAAEEMPPTSPPGDEQPAKKSKR